MSGECDQCNEHTLECICRESYRLENICEDSCPCKLNKFYNHMQLVSNPPNEHSYVKYINVRGREEHEEIIKDAAWCEELGLDQEYELMIYLKQWGEWLSKY